MNVTKKNLYTPISFVKFPLHRYVIIFEKQECNRTYIPQNGID